MVANKNIDVIVVGGGIFGLSCAYACALRGKSVRVVDAGLIGNGASGGIIGALSPYLPDQWNDKKQYQYNALSRGKHYWKEIDHRSNLKSGFNHIGRYSIIADERTYKLAQQRVDEALKNWSGYRWELHDHYDLINPITAPFSLIYDTLSARIYPRSACASLAKTCLKLGVEFHEYCTIEGFSDYQIHGVWGTQEAKAIILAAGFNGFKLLSRHFGKTMGSGVKGQSALLDIDLGNAPQIYADGIYIVPHKNGKTAVGSTSENHWQNPYAVDNQLDNIIERARRICPILKTAPICERWAQIRPKSRRGDPILGAMPDVAGLFLAMGGFKIGFGLAPSIGETLADFIDGHTPNLPKSFTLAHHLQ